MTGIQDIATIILVSAGILSMLVGSLGVVRLPDFYTRTHAVSKSDALGIICVISGLIIHEGATINSLKLFFIVLFIMLSNPIGTHALARVAWINGVKPLLGANAGTDGSYSSARTHMNTGSSVSDSGATTASDTDSDSTGPEKYPGGPTP